MKALLKYPLSLFILLLIGYSQLVAPLYRGSAPSQPTKKITELASSQTSINVEASDVQTIFIAEEEEEKDDRICFKKHTDLTTVFSFIHSPGYFISRIKNDFSARWDFSHFAFSQSPYLVFRVFRL